MRFPLLIAAATLALAALPAAAHHGWSSYDETKPVTLTASFAELSWGNPHGSAKMRWRQISGTSEVPTRNANDHAMARACSATGSRSRKG